MEQAARQQDELALSQLALRQGLGVMGIALPAVLLMVSALSPTIALQRSISAYYYVPHLRDLLVGVLWAIGAFLVFYRGYRNVPKAFQSMPTWLGRHMTDSKLTTLAGIGALATATLPTCEIADLCTGNLIADLHLASAVTFLGTLAVLSIWSFTESNTDPKDWDAAKRWSNLVYIICGWTILAALAAAGLVIGLRLERLGPFTQPVFWLETIAIWAFGISWLVKGEAIQGLISLMRPNKAPTTRNAPQPQSRT
jgi:hypothetical protein